MTSPVERMASNAARGGWPAPVRKTPAVEEDDPCGYVVHVPVAAADLGAAMEVGRAVVAALRHMAAVEVGSTLVSPEGRPDRHHALCCNRRLIGDRRCLLAPGHAADEAGAGCADR
jgi:hypothetical protein